MAYKNNWAKSIIINLVIMIVVMVFTDITYETNDDYAISGRIAGGDAYVGYVDFGLCYVMILIQDLFPAINVFVAFQIIFSFISFTIVTKILFDSDKGALFNFVIVLIIAFLSFDLYGVIQFTKTSGLALCAGLLLLTDTMIRNGTWASLIISFVMVYVGAGIRITNAPIALGFAGLFVLFYLIENREYMKKNDFPGKGKKAWLTVSIVLVAFIGIMYLALTGINTSTPELKTYQDYNDQRSMVVDFSQFERFDKYEEEFESIGLSRNDLYLIDNWYFDREGAASIDNLRKISNIYGKSRASQNADVGSTLESFLKRIAKGIKKTDQEGLHIILLIGVAAAAFLGLRPRYWIYIIAVGTAVLCMHFMLFYMERMAYRALFVIDVNAVLWILYYMDGSRLRQGQHTTILRGVIGVGACVALLFGSYMEYDHCMDAHRSIEKKIRPAELSERISNDRDHMYVFSTREKTNPSSYGMPLKAPDGDDNVVTFGSWGTGSPYVNRKIEKYGLDNVFGDIIDDPVVYVVESKRVANMEEYFNKWYGGKDKRITYKRVAVIDGYRIWEVVSEPVETDEIQTKEEESSRLN